MRRWIRYWRRSWRPEQVVMSSELAVEVVRERLRARSITKGQAAFRGGVRYGVLGRIGEPDIALEAGWVAVAITTRPKLGGRLEPTPTGCRVVGTITRFQPVMAYAMVLVALAGVGFLILAAHAVIDAVTGDFSGWDLLACLVPVSFAVLFFGISTLGTLGGRRDVTYLKLWLAECLGPDGERGGSSGR